MGNCPPGCNSWRILFEKGYDGMNSVELTTSILTTNLINNTDTDISSRNNADIESSLCMALCNVAYCSGRLSVMI